jgi:hypothetical protein
MPKALLLETSKINYLIHSFSINTSKPTIDLHLNRDPIFSITCNIHPEEVELKNLIAQCDPSHPNI